MLLSGKRLFPFFHALPAYPVKLQFMIQDVEACRFLNMILQIIEKIRIKRGDLSTSPAYKMMMIVFCFPLKKMSELIAHTPVVKADPVHQLHIP